MGADVLWVDSPRLPEIPAQALDVLPGKRSALLDFAEPAGQARLEDLLATADVLVQGYRPGALDRYGLAVDDLTRRHPHLTVVTLNAWGPTGPWAARRGFDSLVQCPTGIAHTEGHDGRPGALPAQVLDHATGYLAAAAALLCLAGAVTHRAPGRAQLSLAQTAEWLHTDSDPATPTGPERPVDATPWLVTLPGADSPVTVIGPPGRIDGRTAHWNATSRYGADQPAWSASR